MAVLIAAVSAIGGVSFWKLNQAGDQSPVSSLLVLPDARVIADFALTDQHSQPFSLADLRGKWSLLFFGFTNCPDVCPGALFELQRVNQSMQQALGAKAADQLQILFISVDPERDTAAKMEQYLAYFDPVFIGITGDQVQLLPLTRQLGIAYRIEEHEPGAPRYDVAHSASILLMDPQGRLYGAFPQPHDAEKIVADLLAIIED
jgi:protein SCO1/2